PFIVGREVMIVTHSLDFAPKTAAAIPRTLRLVPQTLEKRRAVKRSRRMEPRALRLWLGGRKRSGRANERALPLSQPDANRSHAAHTDGVTSATSDSSLAAASKPIRL